MNFQNAYATRPPITAQSHICGTTLSTLSAEQDSGQCGQCGGVVGVEC